MTDVNLSMMGRFYEALPSWPPVAACILGITLAVSAVHDSLGLKVKDVLPPKTPKLATPEFSYAPAPGRDDRTPIAFLSQVFGLNDPSLPSKLTGIGPVFWKHSGQGTGALIAPNVVLTTAHLFVKNGDWKGAGGAVPVPPAASDGFIFLAACGKRYAFKSIEVGSEAPRSKLGLDYAIAVLDQPACDEAMILPVASTPQALNGDNSVMLNMGSYAFADLTRYKKHRLFTKRKKRSGGMHKFGVFGVRCEATGREDTGDVASGSTGIIVTEGCDGVPGGSGGPLLYSDDGGASYRIVGVANSYMKNTEYNNYTRIEGAFTAHLNRHVQVQTSAMSIEAGQVFGATPPNQFSGKPWRGMNR